VTQAAPDLVEYLYGRVTGEDERGYLVDRVIPLRITKKTQQRIYYVRWEGPCGDIETGFINRQEIEAQGYVYTRRYGHRDHCLYLEPPDVDAHRRQPSLAELKQAMADAHPDRGGTDAQFIAAREKYQRARARAERQP
jgi:hypothetical protein